MSRALTVLAVAAAVVAVGFGIGGPLVGDGVFLGVDRLLTHAPWSAAAPTGFTPTDACIADTVDSVLPQREAFLRQLRAGTFGSWNPDVAGGAVLASTPDPALFTPLAVAYYLLPTWLAPAWTEFLVLAVALAGMYLFLRRLTLSPPAAVVGGIVFATSGFMLAWTNWPQVQVAAFIPALFWTVDRLAVQRRLVDAAPVALVVACMLLGGFPAVTGWALYAAAPYLLLRAWGTRTDPTRTLFSSAGIGLLGVGLGAALVGVLLLPFIGQLHVAGVNYRAQLPSEHLPLLSLATALVPKAMQGACMASWWPVTTNVIEGMSYVGGAALVLLTLGLLRRPVPGVPRGVRGFLAVGLAVVVVLVYVGGTPLSIAQHLPVFTNNFVGRLRCLLGFFAAGLAAFGFDRVVRRSPQRRPRWEVGLEVAGWAAAAAATWVVVHRLTAIGVQYHHAAAARADLIGPLVGAALAFAAVLAAPLLHDWRRTAVLGLVPVVVAAQALAIWRPFLPRPPKKDFYPVTATHRFLAAHLGDERYVTDEFAMEPGSNSYYGLAAATGHVFTEQGWKNMLLTVAPDSFPTPTYSTLPMDITAARLASPLLDLMSVRYVVRDPSDPLLGSTSTFGGSGAATTLAPGQTLALPVPAAAIRGVGPVLAAPVHGHGFAGLRVRLVTSGGRQVAADALRLLANQPAGPLVVPLAAESAAGDGPLTALISLTGGAGPVQLVSGGAGLAGAVVTDPGDGLRLVYAADSVIYQRAGVLPPFTWASTATVVSREMPRLTVLANTRVPDRVVLSSPGPAACGQAGTVRVRRDAPESITLDVTAAGCGYVVVSEALQGSSWRATVDGRAARLRAADEGLVAVRVPAGRHVVHLYDSRNRMKLGMLATAAAALVLAALYVAERRRRRRRV